MPRSSKTAEKQKIKNIRKKYQNKGKNNLSKKKNYYYKIK